MALVLDFLQPLVQLLTIDVGCAAQGAVLKRRIIACQRPYLVDKKIVSLFQFPQPCPKFA